MRTIEIIREFNTPNCTVRVRAVDDDDFGQALADMDKAERRRIERRIDSGELVGFGVVAETIINGEYVSEDSLWGCIYESPKAFMDHIGLAAKSRKDKRNYGSYFKDMVHTVCREARAAMEDTPERILRADRNNKHKNQNKKGQTET